MEKTFYTGQPLIIKETGDRVTFVYDYGEDSKRCVVLKNGNHFSHEYYGYEELEPSTEFKFSEILAGLEQGYFEVGTKFRMPSINRVITVEQGVYGLRLEGLSEQIYLTSKNINSTWILEESRKEMSLEEIEAELGYKIKLKEKIGG